MHHETQHFVGFVNNKMLLAGKRIVGDVRGMSKPPRRPPAHLQKRLFGERLRTARERKFASAAEFARHIKIEGETYRRWERGETEPGIVDLSTIIEELEVSADYLVTGALPPPPFSHTK